MSMKGHRRFAATSDFFSQWGEAKLLRPLREHILGDATGRVLEIGAGTGASFPYYQAAERLVVLAPR
jgi:hypothetical protein